MAIGQGRFFAGRPGVWYLGKFHGAPPCAWGVADHHRGQDLPEPKALLNSGGKARRSKGNVFAGNLCGKKGSGAQSLGRFMAGYRLRAVFHAVLGLPKNCPSTSK